MTQEVAFEFRIAESTSNVSAAGNVMKISTHANPSIGAGDLSAVCHILLL